jgi:hypothetical protein
LKEGARKVALPRQKNRERLVDRAAQMLAIDGIVGVIR